jgi:hypothetical protein
MLDRVEEIASGRNGSTGKTHSIESGSIGSHSPMNRQATICDICSSGNDGNERFLALFNQRVQSLDIRSSWPAERKRTTIAAFRDTIRFDADEYHVVICVHHVALLHSRLVALLETCCVRSKEEL